MIYGILVVGWLDQPTTLKIAYEGKNYAVVLNHGLFTVGCPYTVDNRPILDIYAKSNSNHNLSITFHDESGNIVEIPYYKETLE